jgi:hypothetical protein
VDTTYLDDLELELRKLPGVRAAGFTERDDMLIVQVQVAGDEPTANLSHQAARIAYRHADKPVALEIVRWKTISVPAAAPAVLATPAPAPAPPPPTDGAVVPVVEPAAADNTRQRVRLLAVLTFPDTDELEVHLTFGGRRIIGRSAAGAGVAGAATATIEGLRTFAPTLDGELNWCSELDDQSSESTSVVACSVAVGDQVMLGIASGPSRIEAAARATLHALNRSLEKLTGEVE